MELNRGDVIVNLKSSKEYAVCDVRLSYGGTEYRVDYIGIRNGKSFGPVRSSRLTNVLADWGKTAKAATFADGCGWHVVEVK